MLAVPILQIKCTVLAIILWAIGTEPRTHCNYSDLVTEFRYSFLVIPSPTSLLDMSRRGFRNYEALPRSDQYEYPPRQSFFSHIKTFFRMQFHRRVTLSQHIDPSVHNQCLLYSNTNVTLDSVVPVRLLRTHQYTFS